MLWSHRVRSAGVCGAFLLASHFPGLTSADTSRTLIIGVDHVDPANQDPTHNRVFEYTDFFSRDVEIDRGDVLDFRTAPGAFHIVAITRDEQEARHKFPVAQLDNDDPNAVGSQHKKILLGPSNGPITAGNVETGTGHISGPNDASTCGLVHLGESPCRYTGGDDLESAGGVFGGDAQGNPAVVDWNIAVDAGPGEYS